MDYSYEGKCSGWELNPQNLGSKPSTYSIRLLEHIIGGVLLHLLPLKQPQVLCRPSLNEPIISLESIYGVIESHLI